jgi:hypothetical protein
MTLDTIVNRCLIYSTVSIYYKFMRLYLTYNYTTGNKALLLYLWTLRGTAMGPLTHWIADGGDLTRYLG